MAEYIYPLSSTSTGKFSCKRFVYEIAYMLPEANIGFTAIRGPNIIIRPSEELSAADKAVLDAIISAHTGELIPTGWILGTVNFADSEAIITNSAEWQVIGGVLANTAYFHPETEDIRIQIIGNAQCIGEGAEIRVIEVDESGLTPDVVMNPNMLSVSESPTFTRLDVQDDVAPRSSMHYYRVEARLNNATSFILRNLALVMLRIA